MPSQRARPTHYTEGHGAYSGPVEGVFEGSIEYPQLINPKGSEVEDQKRYSRARIEGIMREKIAGKPDPAYISTSYAEWQNLPVRTSMRRFNWLINAFSKKVENLAHTGSLHSMYYNFGRIHKTLRVTPVMEAAIMHHVWSLKEIAQLAN